MKKVAFLSVILVICLTSAFSVIKADPAKPKVYVDPKDNVFSVETTSVGTNFTIGIKAADFVAPGVFSYEFKLYYNTTMLEAVYAEVPADHWLKPVKKPTNIIVVDGGTIDPVAGMVSFAASLLAPEDGKTGGGTIATITLTITAAPAAGQNLTSTLVIADVTLVDPEAIPIPTTDYDIENGNYAYTTPPPPPAPKAYVYVDPKDSIIPTGTPVGSNFNVSIKTLNWTTPGVFGYAFKLYYNNTILQAVEAKIPVDHWLKPANPSNINISDPGTINQDAGFVSFAASLLSGEQGKTGSGTISTITFNITQAPPTDGNVSCSLEIRDLVLTDPTGAQISSDKYDIINGTYLLSAAPPTHGADLDGDGKVNIKDIAIWAKAFGSRPGHSRWNPIADLDGSGRIDVLDAVLICRAWTGA